MSTRGWTAVLDEFEARIHAQREALEMGSALIAPWHAPAVDEPLPRDLVERATELVWQCRELEDEIARALGGAAASLDQLLAAPPVPTQAAQPMYFDSRI